MESRQCRVWHQSEGGEVEHALRADAMRDFVAIPYSARGALIPYQSFGLDKKIPSLLRWNFFVKGGQKRYFSEFGYGLELV